MADRHPLPEERPMPQINPKLRLPPRWKEIFDQVCHELPSYAYGSAFYSITDICEKFSVSRITAIRVLNELATRNLIEKLPGKGNVVRRVSQRVSIRLIIPSAMRRDYGTLDPVDRRLVEGIIAAARTGACDYDTIRENHLQGLFPRLDSTFGFLVPRPVSRATREFLKVQNLPFVLVDPWEHYKNFNHARVDRILAGYLATRHLLDLGHRRIAWITGVISQPNFRDRLKGYRKALREAGLPFNWSYVSETASMAPEQDHDALDALLDLQRPPTAIILGDDTRGIHIANACRTRGIRIPQDLSLIGYPNSPETSLTTPPLSVIDANFESVGRAAVAMILDILSSPQATAPIQRVIEPQLVLRSSTGPPRRPRRTQSADRPIPRGRVQTASDMPTR
jgi:hypothetical protein